MNMKVIINTLINNLCDKKDLILLLANKNNNN